MKHCAYCEFAGDEPDFGAHVRAAHPSHFAAPRQERDLLLRFHADVVLAAVALFFSIGLMDTATYGRGADWAAVGALVLYVVAGLLVATRPIQWWRRQVAGRTSASADPAGVTLPRPAIPAGQRRARVKSQMVRTGALLTAFAFLAFVAPRPAGFGPDLTSFGVALLIIWFGIYTFGARRLASIEDDSPSTHQRLEN